MFTDFINQFLLSLEPERAHRLALNALQIAEKTSLLRPFYHKNIKPIKLMGISFPNPIGLAAGLDKNGDYIDALAALGFGFIEIGTITPKPQPGNPMPRLFRLPEKKPSLIVWDLIIKEQIPSQVKISLQVTKNNFAGQQVEHRLYRMKYKNLCCVIVSYYYTSELNPV